MHLVRLIDFLYFLWRHTVSSGFLVAEAEMWIDTEGSQRRLNFQKWVIKKGGSNAENTEKPGRLGLAKVWSLTKKH